MSFFLMLIFAFLGLHLAYRVFGPANKQNNNRPAEQKIPSTNNEHHNTTAMHSLNLADVPERAMAFLIDLVILSVIGLGFYLLYFILLSSFHFTFEQRIVIQSLIFLETDIVLLFYFVLGSRSKDQATYGKRIMNLKVSTLNQEKIKISQAWVRAIFQLGPLTVVILYLLSSHVLLKVGTISSTFADGLIVFFIGLGLLSWLVLIVSILLTGLHSKRQTIHDLICKTVVLKQGASKLD